ncbi:MAG TPA: malto-oligosyltrehalose synthase [Roseiflexaceae bacterium]|nr:malto-oligosyltrehalose synthase [Roseiflexaceae bacterium]
MHNRNDPPHQRLPRATYRLQFNADFTFHDAARLAGYFEQLGISDLYASPILRPRSGSGHGYDIVDHSQINPVLGGEQALEELGGVLRAHGLGLILDVVPNHMGIGAENAWWMDVLENGPSSLYADHFDIDWRPVRPELADKVLLPILGDQYGDVLERGELRLHYEAGAFVVSYYDHRLPVAPRGSGAVLRHRLGDLLDALGEEHPAVQELQSILTAIGYLPPRAALPPLKQAERNREKEIIKRRLANLVLESPEVRAMIDTALADYNGRPGDPASFDLLDELLADQPYRPAFWRVAAEEINYRRFFDINELAAIRVELPAVFEATHQTIFRLLAGGLVTGLRIDHPDGLRDPSAYFRALQERAAALGDSLTLDDATALAPSPQPPAPPLYVVAEKILSPDETLPGEWQIAGTTGYDFLNVVGGLLVDQRSAVAFDAIYTRFIGTQTDYANLTNSTRKMIMLVSLASEVGELSAELERIAESNRRYRDFTLNSLTFALREVLAALPVYRTYLTGPDSATEHDVRTIRAAVAEARRRNPRTAAAIFGFIEDTLLLRNLERFPSEAAARLVAFVLKFQQVSGPVMAKGVEDTAFYVYNRLLSLNEVGGHPEHFGADPAAFHAHNVRQRRDWPHTMLTTSTHDTKRSEDVRARLHVLSELPEGWEEALAAWSLQSAAHKRLVDGAAAPDRNDEYLLYQTLIGVWPLEALLDGATPDPDRAFRDRIVAYMHKATKEAKRLTSWVNPNAAYDEALRLFVEAVLDAPPPDAVQSLLRQVAFFGLLNSLSQTLLKLTAPGVPDIYQGCELWDFSLVDPDNRRPVDYAYRHALLAELRGHLASGGPDAQVALVADLLRNNVDGRIKLYVTYRALVLRRDCPELFSAGDYTPLAAVGLRHAHVVAFARTLAGAEVLTVTPRLCARLAGGALLPPVGAAVWGDTALLLPGVRAGARYRNLFTGDLLEARALPDGVGLPLADVLRIFPVALLQAEADGS